MHFPKHSRQQQKKKKNPSSGSGSHHLLPGRSPRSNPIFEKDKTKRTKTEMIVSKQDKRVK